MGAVVETPEEIDAVMAATGPARHLLFDSGYRTFGGGNPEEVLARHVGPRRAFPCQEHPAAVTARVRAENLSFLQGVLAGTFTVPGGPEGAMTSRRC